MTFAWPHLLWLLLLPVALLAWELTRRRRADALAHPKILHAEAGARHLSLVTRHAAARRARPWLWAGLACALVALARPQWGRLEAPVFDQAREILIAIDLSRSMLTPDVKPSRLDRAKLLTQSLLEKLNGERIGLVVFSGTAFLQSPLSADYEILREFLPALNPSYLPEGGTNYTALIDTAITAFDTGTSADRFLIVLSDGEATDDGWRARMPDLKKKGIRVIGLGIGTSAGAMIPDGSGGFVKDQRGAVVLSKLESTTLRQLADLTGGTYRDASSWIDLASVLKSTVEAGRKGKFVDKNTIRLVERFQWPLALALWCFLVSFYYEFPVRPKPRALKLTAPDNGAPKTKSRQPVASPPPPAAIAALLIILSAFLLAPSALHAEVTLAPPSAPLTTTPLQPAAPAASAPAKPEPPPLAKIVARLAAADQRTGRDWAELGRETVSWGSRLKTAQKPVPEGPVRDALKAVDLGSKLDPKTTDWPKLRHDLEALLQKPQDQKKPQDKPPQKQDQKKSDQQNKNQDQQKPDQKDQNQGQPNQQKQDPNSSSSQSDQPQPKDASQKQSPPPAKSDADKSSGKDKPQNSSAFGDMQQHDKPPPPSHDTQKVGGVAAKKGAEKPPVDPALALPQQKLDQLHAQDSPAELFQLMDPRPKSAPQKNSKDW
jgi:Ca-activated chloride channel family protein